MADTILYRGLTNGVSFGHKYVVTDTDVTNGGIQINFQVSYPLAASVIVTTSAGVNVPLVDATIDCSVAGIVRIAEGSTFALVAGYILIVTAQRDDSDLTRVQNS